jgi:hypothetical protein
MSLNLELLRTHILKWKSELARDPARTARDQEHRLERLAYYQSHTADIIRAMNAEQFYEYISKLYAMLIWGNKKYVVDKLISDNGFAQIKNELAEFVWGSASIEVRWDHFRKIVKGMGPAMMSEILCQSRPAEYMLWNRRAYVGLRYLGVEDLPRYNYQVTGKRYSGLCDVAKRIAGEMNAQGISRPDLLTVDFFIWDELQVEENLSQIHKKPDLPEVDEADIAPQQEATKVFLHNEVRDKLEQIGLWLGFDARTEVKIADGAVVDTVWESSIGNLGRVIYVFEVQTKGSIDSLLVNLLKSLNNPAVQGIVAVSDSVQIERIKKEAAAVRQLREKLKFWDYKEVLRVHEALEAVNESINGLGLVPDSILSA